MKLKEIQNLIKFVAKSGASEVKLEMENVKITIKTTDEKQPIVVQETVPVNVAPSAAHASQVQPPVVAEQVAETVDDNKYITVKSPIIGTFTVNLHLTSKSLLRLVIRLAKERFYVLSKL